MRRFKSLEEIRNATAKQLMELPEINERTALEIVDFFSKQSLPNQPTMWYNEQNCCENGGYHIWQA